MAKKDNPASGFGAEEKAKAQRLITELNASEKYWKPYWDRCNRILTRYEQDKEKAETTPTRRRFAVLWANTETLKPHCYAKVPKAVVLRTNQDDGPVFRIAAEVLERGINFSLECYDFDQVLKDIRDEFLLLAKGQPWIRYVPTLEPAEQTPAVDTPPPAEDEDSKDAKKGQKGKKPVATAAPEDEQPPAEVLKYEEVVCDHVAYDDWGTNACRKWEEARLVWRRVYMSRPALKRRFTKKVPGTNLTVGALVALDWKPEGSTDANREDFGKAIIYEVWDRDEGCAYWINKGFPNAPLDERVDPLGLKDFFPCPKPAMGTTSPRRIFPTPDLAYYQDQAEELDDLSGRIAILVKAVRMVGFYAGDSKIDLQKVFRSAADNDLVPVDSWAKWMEKGGIKGLVEWVPVDMVMRVVEALRKEREAVLQVIYQITGISDIMRGATDPRETAAAQGIKTTWGSSRVRDKQKEMERFCRDVMRLKGEVIAKKFSIDTYKAMTGIKLLTREEKTAFEGLIAQHQQQAAMMQAQQPPPQPGAPPAAPQQPPPPPLPPGVEELMAKPTWEDVDELLKSDDLRNFRIDIESDSTVEPDQMNDKKDAGEFATAFGTLIGQSLPVMQAFPPFAKIVSVAAKKLAAKYNFGREMEEVIEQVMDLAANQQPAPPQGQQKTGGKSPEELAIMQESNAIKREQVKGDLANSQMDAQTNAASVAAERERTASEERIAAMENTMRKLEAFLDAQTRAAEARAAPTNGAAAQ